MGGDPQDGGGQDDRVFAAEQPGGDPRGDVGEGVGDHLLLAQADERGESFLGAGELQEDEEMAIVAEPTDGRPDALLDATGRVVLVGDGLSLGQPEAVLCIGQDLAEQLVLRVKVPVEDALATPIPSTMSVTEVGWYPWAAKRWAAKSIRSLRRWAPLGVCRRSTIETTLRASPRPGQSSRVDRLDCASECNRTPAGIPLATWPIGS